MQIAIVEDEPALLQTLSLILAGEPGFDVVATYRSAEEAIADLDRAGPDILLVDLALPGMSGVDLIRKIKGTRPCIDIIVYSGHGDRNTVLAAVKAGASGYLVKGATPRELIEALHSLIGGGAPMSPKVARTIINELRDQDIKDRPQLTSRQEELLRSLERGLSYKEMAEKHNISRHTVHTHIKNIYDKLDASDREEAIRRAKRLGIL